MLGCNVRRHHPHCGIHFLICQQKIDRWVKICKPWCRWWNLIITTGRGRWSWTFSISFIYSWAMPKKNKMHFFLGSLKCSGSYKSAPLYPTGLRSSNKFWMPTRGVFVQRYWLNTFYSLLLIWWLSNGRWRVYMLDMEDMPDDLSAPFFQITE